jgi:hypothetical protein
MTRATRLIDALRQVSSFVQEELSPSDSTDVQEALWPIDEPSNDIPMKRMAVRVDGRDWRHQQHIGERYVWIGRIAA